MLVLQKALAYVIFFEQKRFDVGRYVHKRWKLLESKGVGASQRFEPTVDRCACIIGDLFLINEGLYHLRGKGRSSDFSKGRIKVQPNIAIRLLVAVPFLPFLILEVKAQKIADCRIRRGNLPIIDLLAALVQKPHRILFIL